MLERNRAGHGDAFLESQILRRLRWEDGRFKVSLRNMARTWLEIKSAGHVAQG